MGNNPIAPLASERTAAWQAWQASRGKTIRAMPAETPLPTKPDPRLWGHGYVAELHARMRHRRSLLPYRRRRAYAACLRVIEWREADLWPDP